MTLSAGEREEDKEWGNSFKNKLKGQATSFRNKKATVKNVRVKPGYRLEHRTVLNKGRQQERSDSRTDWESSAFNHICAK
jgi:hypothetical protein